MCAMNKQTSSASSTSAASSASSTASTTTPPDPSKVANIATTIPSPTTTSSTAVAAAASASTQCSSFPGVAVIAGFFPGMLAGALLAVLVIICLGRRREKKRQSGSFGRVSATVSDPIYLPQLSSRTDFLRRESRSKHRSSRVRSLFSRQPPPQPQSQHQEQDGIGRSFMRTPEMKKEPSTESIRVFTPVGGAAGLRPQTTFTDMMASAGFRQNEPYLGSPGRVDPRVRNV
ncbi:MAG: hypothetical protein M1830_006999 [Pleopsidium flavum]|nr:MAG: hypothetical protein M1830_006999 [Pleopsidium flavum]